MDDSKSRFGELLAAMPQIAEAVNAFNSTETQELALNSLLQAFSPSTTSSDDRVHHNDVASPQVETTHNPDSNKKNLGSNPRRKGTSKKVDPVRDINFHPQGKKSLRDLAAEKIPTNADQRNVIAVWWLENEGGIPAIGVGHVLACYKACNWREPANLSNALAVTASRMAWIDTKDMRSIITTPLGRNTVEQDMPLDRK
ncbi:MAG TPA: hypothetical protein VGT61_15715 [Thermomicrobiales bacterium]|jgi:hypothetical protein|nr:hypothetical protein [Thermomicrobiales bacterium]